MVEPSLRTPLVTPVGATALLPPHRLAATGAAIAMPAITRYAEEKHCTATTENPLPENCFVWSRRHASSQAGLDNGTRFVAA